MIPIVTSFPLAVIDVLNGIMAGERARHLTDFDLLFNVANAGSTGRSGARFMEPLEWKV